MSSPTKTWIQSRTGRKIELLKPDPAVVEIEDIAHALSNLCRYTGHTSTFYSVAEHSVLVALRAEDLAISHLPATFGFEGRVRDVARWGLLHDASEAYLGDVSRPLKYLPHMEPYRALEKEWMKAIAERFGLEGSQPPEVTQADNEALGTEARLLMSPVHPDWGATCPGGTLPDPLPGIELIGMGPRDAKSVFLIAFNRLFPEFKK